MSGKAPLDSLAARTFWDLMHTGTATEDVDATPAETQTILPSRLGEQKMVREFGPEPLAALYLRQADLNIVIGSLAALCILVISLGHVPKPALWTWGSAFGLLTAYQAHRRYRGRGRKLTEERAARLLRHAPLQVTLAGLLFGVTALALPSLPEGNRVALATTALGLAVAATTTLSSVPRAAILFTSLIVLPYVAVFALTASFPEALLAVLGMFFLGAILLGLRINVTSLRTELAARRQAIAAQRELSESQALWLEFSRSAEAFALYDEGGRLLLWNDAYRTLIGAATGELAAGKPFTDIGAPNLSALTEHSILLDPPSLETDFVETSERDGRWYQTSISPLRNGHIAVTHVDITGLKANEAKLIALRDILLAERNKAEAANRAKSDFLAKMSHELRTPLNAVIGFADLIVQDHERDRYEPQRHAGYGRLISDSGRHLLSIVDDLLDLTKIETGRIDLRESEVDLVDLVHSARLLVEGREDDRRVSFAESYPEQAVTLWADRRLLKQAILNLIENAVKFSDGAAEIRLAVELDPSGGVTVSVDDDGIGIPPDMLEEVQEAFVQLEGSDTRQYGGVGLGLSLVREFARLHGGALELESEPGSGTTARLILPRERRLAA